MANHMLAAVLFAAVLIRRKWPPGAHADTVLTARSPAGVTVTLRALLPDQRLLREFITRLTARNARKCQ